MTPERHEIRPTRSRLETFAHTGRCRERDRSEIRPTLRPSERIPADGGRRTRGLATNPRAQHGPLAAPSVERDSTGDLENGSRVGVAEFQWLSVNVGRILWSLSNIAGSSISPTAPVAVP